MFTRAWHYAGVSMEVLHGAFLIIFIVLGRLWMPPHVVNMIILVTVVGQMICGCCPLYLMADYCFRRHNPDHKSLPSSTIRLYKRFGRLIGIPIFVALITLSWAIEVLVRYFF